MVGSLISVLIVAYITYGVCKTIASLKKELRYNTQTDRKTHEIEENLSIIYSLCAVYVFSFVIVLYIVLSVGLTNIQDLFNATSIYRTLNIIVVTLHISILALVTKVIDHATLGLTRH